MDTTLGALGKACPRTRFRSTFQDCAGLQMVAAGEHRMARPEARAAVYSPQSPIHQPGCYRSATTGVALNRRAASPERSYSPLRATINRSPRMVRPQIPVSLGRGRPSDSERAP